MPENPLPSPIQRILEEAFNQGNLAIVDEVTASGYTAHSPLYGAPTGVQGLKWVIVMFRGAFPDLHCTVEDEIRQGDRLATHWVMRGTHTGPFLGNQPTGKPVEIQGIVFARTENGRILEDWTLIDQLGILQQLGIVPPSRGVPVYIKDA